MRRQLWLCQDLAQPHTDPRFGVTSASKEASVKGDVQENWTQQARWIGEDNLIYGGLIGIGVFMVQPLITAVSLDVPAKICIVAFALAIPLLAVLVMINQLRSTYHSAAVPRYLNVAKVVAQTSAFVGVIAAFWHVLWLAGVVVLLSGIAGVVVHTLYYQRLLREGKVKLPETVRP